MIFGFLGNFWIDIEKNPYTNKKFQDEQISKKIETYFSRQKMFEIKIFGKVNKKNENSKISGNFEIFMF